MKFALILLTIICLVSAEDKSLQARMKKKYYGIPGVVWRGSFWAFAAFVAVKAKIIIAITVATWFFTLGMKGLMALKYGKEFVKCGHPEVVFSPPLNSLGHEYSSGTAEYAPAYYPPSDSYGPPSTPNSDSNYEKYGRKMDWDEIFEQDYSKYMKKLLNKVDLTEYAFESMNMTQEACKQRFVCEMDLYSKRSTLLSFGLIFFSDQGLNKYRNTTINAKTLQQCHKTYPECKQPYRL